MKIQEGLYYYPAVESFEFITCNSYLIADEVTVLVDPGAAENVQNLLHFLKEDGFSIRDIDLILNTHAHPDHCGANAKLKALGSLKIALHKEEFNYLPTCEAVARMFNIQMPPFQAEVQLQTILDLGKKQFQVIHTPGHTPGSLCLYDAERKSLISGDTVFPGGNIGRTDLPGGDPHELLKSIKKLCLLAVGTLCSGHMDIATEDVEEQLKASCSLAELALGN